MDGHGQTSLMLENFRISLQRLTDRKRLFVAYSGGLDSHVLLDLAVQVFGENPDYQIGALHVNHGISRFAEDWVQHCEKVCTALQVSLNVLWVDAKETEGNSPEEVARELRYSAFENFLEASDSLLLAHHEADQAETILLRLFRGAGPLGLGGIQERVLFGKSEILRPLLRIPKEDIFAYAKQRQLEWIEDDSNNDKRFDRNFLRQEIMPVIRARWPRVVRSVNRAGALCFETATATQVIALQDFEGVQGKEMGNLSVAKLLQLDSVRRKGVLRHWLQQLKVPMPSKSHMERIDREILQAKPGSKPRLKISHYEILRKKDELSLKLVS